MANPLIQKLSSFTDLDERDKAALDGMCRSTKSLKAGHDLIREGDRPDHVFLLVEGWACRYAHTEQGRRQIVAFLIPGDLCDPHVFILKQMDHSIGLLSDARVAAIPKEEVLAVTREHPAIAQALWWSTLVDEATLRHWLINVAQRDAYDRLAHLFCELSVRLKQVGLVRGGTFDLPLTQEQLGDTVGLTSVHVNRMLQRMRSEGLIALEGRRLTILDDGRLGEVAGFDARYLHLSRRG